jgi:alkylation response protein AidB-like acyl-CoA dehydrogenase
MTTPLIEDEIDAALDDIARKFGANAYNFEERHRLDPSIRRFAAPIWRSIAEMGWFSVATPEEYDGLGLRTSSVTVLAEATGAMFLSEPLTEAFCGAYLVGSIGSEAQKDELFPRIADGSLRLAMGLDPAAWLGDSAKAVAIDHHGRLHGHLPFVVGADIAEMIMVRVAGASNGDAVFLIDPASESVEIAPYPLIDGRGAARVTLAGAVGHRLGDQNAGGDAAIDNALALGALATAADSLGVMDRALNCTVDYLKTRVQFGRPIGTNQVLQHRAVDMYILTAEARAVIAAAVHSGTPGSATFAHSVHAAKAIVDVAARKVVHETIQMHGGIGVADEHMAGQCLKRVMVNEQIYGRRRDHMRLFADGLSDNLDIHSAC